MIIIKYDIVLKSRGNLIFLTVKQAVRKYAFRTALILLTMFYYTLNIRSPYVGNGQSFSGVIVSSSSATALRLCIAGNTVFL